MNGGSRADRNENMATSRQEAGSVAGRYRMWGMLHGQKKGSSQRTFLLSESGVDPNTENLPSTTHSSAERPCSVTQDIEFAEALANPIQKPTAGHQRG